MKLKKTFLGAAAGILSLSLLAACGSDTESDAKTTNGKSTETITWRLAESQPDGHPTTETLEEFSELVSEKTDGSIDIQVNANEVLGNERSTIELVKSGTLEMTRVNSSGLEGFNEQFATFTLPYIFQNQEHYYNAMDNSEAVQEIFNHTKDDGWFALGWYMGGSRNVYTGDTKVETPEDMKGLKIRTPESPTSIASIEAMGGSPVSMSFGEVYTALQQGVIDGAENSELALTSNKHGEVAKQFSKTEHQYIPDALIVSTKAWEELTEEQQTALKDAWKESSESHKERWAEAVEAAEKEATEKMGVTITEVDKIPFIEAAAPVIEEYKAKSEQNKKWIEDIQSFNK